MHHDFILSDIVPLMYSDQAMFVGSEDLVKSLTLFGANSVTSKLPPRLESSPIDPIKLAIQHENSAYQKLLRVLKTSLENRN